MNRWQKKYANRSIDEYLVAKFGFDTEENERSKVWSFSLRNTECYCWKRLAKYLKNDSELLASTFRNELQNIWRINDSELRHRLSEKQAESVVENGKVSNPSGRKWESFKFNIFSTEKMYRERRKTKNEGRRGAIHWGANCHSEQTTQKRSGNFIQIIWLSPILALRYWTRYEK